MSEGLRRARVLVGLVGLAALQASWAAGERPTDVTETLLRGLEARGERQPFAARALVAYLSSREFGEPKVKWTPPDSRPGPAGELLDLFMVDLAVSKPCWRLEIRGIVTSGLDWQGFRGLVEGSERNQGLRTDDLYLLSACDGEQVFRYDRTVRALSVRPFAGPTEVEPGLVPWLWEAVVSTVPPYAPHVLRQEMTVRHMGVETMDGVGCHILVGAGKQRDPKGYMRLWVAPDRGFGVLRLERVETDAEGRVIYCGVTRALDWRQEEAGGLWVPDRWQTDKFDYREGEAKGWTSTRLVVGERLSLPPPRRDHDWVPPFPFDARIETPEADGRPTPDPTRDVEGLLGKLHFEKPDPFGEAMGGADPRAAF